MKLSFNKDEESQVAVRLKFDDEEREFSYVEMIKTLLVDRKMDAPEITGEFTPSETKSINDMVSYINEDLSIDEEADEADGAEPQLLR